MEYQHRRNMIIRMARRGAFYEDPAIARNRNRIHFHSTWFLLRSNTIQHIVDGTIKQTDSSIINSVTLSNNIPRRSMEFVLNAPEQYQAPPPPPQLPLDDDVDDEEDFNIPMDYANNNQPRDEDSEDDQDYGRDSDDFDDDYNSYRSDI